MKALWIVVILLAIAGSGGAAYWFLVVRPKRAAAESARLAKEAAARAAMAKANQVKSAQKGFSDSLAGIGTFFGSLIPGGAGIGGGIGKFAGDLLGPIFMK